MSELQQSLEKLGRASYRFNNDAKKKLLAEEKAAQDNFMEIAQRANYTDPALIATQIERAITKKRLALFYQQYHPEKSESLDYWRSYQNALRKLEHMLLQQRFAQLRSLRLSTAKKSERVKRDLNTIDYALETNSPLKTKGKKADVLNNIYLVRKQMQTIPLELSIAKRKYYQQQMKINRQQQRQLELDIQKLSREKPALVQLEKARKQLDDAELFIREHTKAPPLLKRWLLNANRGALRTFILRVVNFFGFGPDEQIVKDIAQAQQQRAEAKIKEDKAYSVYKKVIQSNVKFVMTPPSEQVQSKIDEKNNEILELKKQQKQFEAHLESTQQVSLPKDLVRNLARYIKKLNQHINTGKSEQLEDFYLSINYLQYEKYSKYFSGSKLPALQTAVAQQSQVDLDDCREHLKELTHQFKTISLEDKLTMYKRGIQDGMSYSKRHPNADPQSRTIKTLAYYVPRLKLFMDDTADNITGVSPLKPARPK